MLVYKHPCSSPTIFAGADELPTVDSTYCHYGSNFLRLQSSMKGGLQ